MDANELKKYLAGLGIAGLLTGGSVIAAENTAGKTGPETKPAPTEKALKSEPSKTAPAKSS
jgi:radical SAM modification target selenobiotic family peptide